jgi:predicted transcriptional regulator
MNGIAERVTTMARTPQDVTEAELALLRRLWNEGQTTIRQLANELYPKGGTAQYATVQKLLERLEDKGYVNRDRRSNVHIFSAAVRRDELIGRRLQAIADTLCDGSVAPLLSHLVKADALSSEDRKSLRELIERLAPEQQRRQRR